MLVTAVTLLPILGAVSGKFHYEAYTNPSASHCVSFPSYLQYLSFLRNRYRLQVGEVRVIGHLEQMPCENG